MEIRAAGRGDATETAQMLARAFHDDPLFGWILPAESSRLRRLRRFFVTELNHQSLRHGGVEVACSDERVAGAAVWFPPAPGHSGQERPPCPDICEPSAATSASAPGMSPSRYPPIRAKSRTGIWDSSGSIRSSKDTGGRAT
jgi:hypothetical protein